MIRVYISFESPLQLAHIHSIKMAKVHKIFGYDEFIGSINKIAESAKELNILFTGKKDEAGKSWCPDCNDGKKNTIFLYFCSFLFLLGISYYHFV